MITIFSWINYTKNYITKLYTERDKTKKEQKKVYIFLIRKKKIKTKFKTLITLDINTTIHTNINEKKINLKIRISNE